MRDRVSQADVEALMAAFKVSASKHALAKRYGIVLGSVDQLLREYGVRQRARDDTLAEIQVP